MVMLKFMVSCWIIVWEDITSFLQKSEHPSVSEFDNEISQHKMAADIFPFVFILVSLLILLSTIKRMISHQRTQIGILKSNGFRDGTLIIHYLSSWGIDCFLASILALILGPRHIAKNIICCRV